MASRSSASFIDLRRQQRPGRASGSSLAASGEPAPNVTKEPSSK